jgi:hypothetical protein
LFGEHGYTDKIFTTACCAVVDCNVDHLLVVNKKIMETVIFDVMSLRQLADGRDNVYSFANPTGFRCWQSRERLQWRAKLKHVFSRTPRAKQRRKPIFTINLVPLFKPVEISHNFFVEAIFHWFIVGRKPDCRLALAGRTPDEDPSKTNRRLVLNR